MFNANIKQLKQCVGLQHGMNILTELNNPTELQIWRGCNPKYPKGD